MLFVVFCRLFPVDFLNFYFETAVFLEKVYNPVNVTQYIVHHIYFSCNRIVHSSLFKIIIRETEYYT